MVPPVDLKKPSGSNIFQKLPHLSTSVWLLIIVVLVLVAVVPMITSYMDATSQQGPLREKLSTLQSQYADLQKQMTPQGSVTTQINQLKLDIEAAKSMYGNACDSVETSRELIDLAWQCNVTITSIKATSISGKVQGKDYPGISYVLVMSGQVANFQNYLIAVGDKFPTSRPDAVIINPATVEGMLDHATLTIWIICNQ